MKEFVKMVCAVICGLIVMSFLGFFMFVGCAGSMALAGSGSEPVLPRTGVLKMDLSTIALSEQGGFQGFDPTSLLLGSGSMAHPVGLWDAVQAVNAAAADPAVKYIYLKPDGASGGLSQLEEFRKALINFRQSGKAIVAWTDSPSTGSYYLASAADKIYMSANAGASPMITGIGTQMVFFGDLLKELGVNVQLIRHGKYKSAGETYIKGEPSPENLEQNQVMINSIWNSFAAEIAESRDMTPEQFSTLIEELSLVTAQDMLDAGLVDELMTRSQLEEKLATLAVVDKFEEVKMIPFADYVTAKVKPNTKAKQKIAVLYAEGNIVEGNSRQQIAGDYFAAQIEKLRKDNSVKAVILRVASPGGSVLASDKIKTEIDLLRAEKPVIASYGDYAASGGYWISNSCDHIFTDRTTLTGSIGVFSMIPDLSKTLKDKLKVGVYTVGSSKHSAMMSGFAPLDEAETAYMQASIETIYDAFLKNVADGRDMTPEQVDEIAQGRVWTGADALGIGLVDEIGTLEDAIKYTASMAGDADLTNWQIVGYPKALSPAEQFLEMFSPSQGKDNEVLAGTPFAPVGQAFRNWNGDRNDRFMARLPYEMAIRY